MEPPRHLRSAARAARGLVTVTLTAVILLTGCRHTVDIGRLLDDPGHFDRRTVKVEGTVVGGAGALGYGAYLVDDGTGVIPVVSRERGVPRRGARVSVTGWFRSLLTVGPESLAGMLERDRDLR